MNTFQKYMPCVFVAACDEMHSKGDVVEITTKYGKSVEVIIHNYLGSDRLGKHLYSQLRADGYDSRERAANKADRLNGAASKAESRSNAAYQASHEGADFLRLAEPIKIGHHSEKRHRALIKLNDDRMRRSVQEQAKADEYARRAEYWEKMKDKIDLGIGPDCIPYFKHLLEKATREHQGLKDGTITPQYSLHKSYATKWLKEAKDKLAKAIQLWGDEEGGAAQ